MTVKKAALYVYVSTFQQADGVFLTRQREELINLAKNTLNIEDVEVFEDVGHSTTYARREYNQMMERIRKGDFSHLLVHHINRISQSHEQFSEVYDELKRCGVTLISKTDEYDTSFEVSEAILKAFQRSEE